MKIIESTTLPATPEAIWAILGDPANMPAWNHKCQSTTAIGRARMGTTYEVTMRLGTRDTQHQAKILTYRPGEEISIRYTSRTTARRTGYVVETFRLRPKGNEHTAVRLEVDISQAPLPLWAKLLAWVMSRIGKPMGPSSLDGIRNLLD